MSEQVTFAIEKAQRQRVEKILDSLGLTIESAMRLVFKQIELNAGLPFKVAIPIRQLKEDEKLRAMTDEERCDE